MSGWDEMLRHRYNLTSSLMATNVELFCDDNVTIPWFDRVAIVDGL
jgi:hypothetical protein